MILEMLLGPGAAGTEERFWREVSGELQTHAGVTVSEDTALNYSAFYRGVTLIAGITSTLPVHIFRRVSDDERERQSDHPLERLLNGEPNDEMDSQTWREVLQVHLLCWGNAYSEIIRAGARPVALYPLHPSRVKPVRKNGVIVYEVTRQPGASPTVLPAEDVFHLKNFGTDGLSGWSIIRRARESIGLGLATEGYGTAFFGNSARPGGVLKHPGKLTELAQRNLRESWERIHSGKDNAHRVAILQEGMDWIAVGMPNEDAEFLATRKFQVTEIARWLGVVPHLLFDLDRCMPADTLVYTEHGPRSIVDVKAGEMVWSPTDEGMRLARVSNSWCSGEDEILCIRTTNRTVRCNAKHRLLARRRVLSPARGLGGVNVDGRKYRVEWVNEYVAAGDLREGDTLVALGRLPEQSQRQAPNGRKLTVEFMEFCGLLMGDGNVIHEQGKPTRVSIARGDAALYMNHYRTSMTREFYCKPTGKELRPVHLVESGRSTGFRSVMAAGELAQLGFAGTAFTKRVPGWVFTVADNLRLAFLRGFLDADGTVNKQGRVAFDSANEMLLLQIRHLCMGLGISVTNVQVVDQVTMPPCAREPVSTRMYRFTCSNPKDSRRIWSHDPRYQQRFAAGKPFGKKDRKYPRHGGAEFSDDHLSLSRIVSVEKQPAEKVYDLEVEGSHCFIASGIVSHNSTNNNIEQQGLEFLIYSLSYWLAKWTGAVRRQLLLPSEKEELYAEYVTDALLKADIQGRYNAYAVAKNNGWMSANDILKRENQKPLGPQGDLYLTPANMVDSRTLIGPNGQPVLPPVPSANGKPPSVPGKPAPEERGANPTPTPRLAVAEHQELLADALARLLRKEVKAAQQAAKRPREFLTWLDSYYTHHEEVTRAALELPLRCLGAIGGRSATAAAIAAQHCQQSRDELLELSGSCTAAELEARVTALGEQWQAQRPGALAEHLIEEAHHEP